MATINLVASDGAQLKIKNYLEISASDELADKINNGVKIVKDDKTFINKKDLNGFMRFASEEARKTVEKGQQSACIEDDVVYGWAIHYFEEDSIEGTLFNEDGTEYKKEIPKSTYTPKPIQKVEKPKEPTLFDFLDTEEEPSEDVSIEQSNDKEPDIIEETKEEIGYVDKSTGEIFDSKEDSIIAELKYVFGDKLEIL